MKKLRVLHLYRTYFPETQGGLQESIRQLCLATQPLAVENTVFALARQPEPAVMELPEGRLIRAKSWLEVASCDLGAWTALRRCRAAADECDIIQIHYPWPFADMLLPFIRRRNQPVLVTYVSDIVRQKGLGMLYSPLRRYLLSKAMHVVASSPNYAESSEILQDYQDKLKCIPHCLGPVSPPAESLCAQWAAQLGRNFFLFVGVLRYYKGLDFLLTAARQVSAPIVIVGDGPEGERLRHEVAARGISNVHFLGAVSDADKHALFTLCRGVVFPSHLRSEAFGMTLLEGAQAAKPLICCEIGTGTSWINRHGETGLVVPPSDPDALAQAMNTLADDDALCQRLGHGARARWEQFFTPQVVGNAYRQLYDEMLSH
ncbi:Alpha-D-kanosaminyltransferase [Polaromonas vacuolata]|uniref:Alpha-D-kanosaminyltransferase n=1 Tax=Polaromonas vacuolata TaxID=37448 RepID=A0A6H2H5R5_9BURK|nr:glycosyltransferase [Polaromonas vacuolata]QJC55222.1 Alpha-D-kanosaminyltransferase [Polaromonas vacuolata]